MSAAGILKSSCTALTRSKHNIMLIAICGIYSLCRPNNSRHGFNKTREIHMVTHLTILAYLSTLEVFFQQS